MEFKQIRESVTRNTAKGLAALTLAALPLICDNGCASYQGSLRTDHPIYATVIAEQIDYLHT